MYLFTLDELRAMTPCERQQLQQASLALWHAALRHWNECEDQLTQATLTPFNDAYLKLWDLCGETTMNTQISMFSDTDKHDVTAQFNDSGAIVVIFATVLDTRQIRRFGFSPAAYLPQVKSMVQTWENVPTGYTGVCFTLKPSGAKDAFTLRSAIAQFAREWIAALETDAVQVSLF